MEEEEKWLEGIASLSLIIRVGMNPAPLEAVRDNQTHPNTDTRKQNITNTHMQSSDTWDNRVS